MSFLPTTADALTQLVHELSKLPGIGEKSATRLAFHLLNADSERVKRLTDALLRAKEKIRLCVNCFTYTESDLCDICVNPLRSQDSICVVERPSDVRALEASGKFKGTYHVLHGTLSPVDGIGPDQIRVQELLRRVNRWDVMTNKEIILALNPSVEGEATALYISRLLRPMGIKLAKIAYGLPMGGSIEYADRGTLGRALENRTEC
jgi:recombination protein RecR